MLQIFCCRPRLIDTVMWARILNSVCHHLPSKFAVTNIAYPLMIQLLQVESLCCMEIIPPVQLRQEVDLMVHCSLWMVHCSLCMVHCSLFFVQGSLFFVHGSLCIAHCSLCIAYTWPINGWEYSYFMATFFFL